MSLLLGILIFLLLSAFFSGSEIAFISANKLRIELRIEEKDSGTGRILKNFYNKPQSFLSTMLVGNNISLVILTTLMTSLIEPWLISTISNQTLLLFLITIIITVFVLIFGEYMPKTFFRMYANEAMTRLAYPLQFFKILLAIPSWIFTMLSDFFLKVFFNRAKEEGIQPFSRVDLQNLIETEFGSEDISSEVDADLFTNALHLQNTKLKDCLIPRNEIVSIDVEESIETLEKLIDETKLSRILVYEEELEKVIGYIHHRQLLSSPSKIKPLVLDINFVPEAMNVTDLLDQFRQNNENIACVVDEFGSLSGIVTIEDLLEEIFGDIEDEHDDEDHEEVQISEDEWLFSGRLEIDYLNDKYEGINFPDHNEFNTLSGYMITLTEDIPEVGEEIETDNYTFIIEKVQDTKIDLIRVIKKQEE